MTLRSTEVAAWSWGGHLVATPSKAASGLCENLEDDQYGHCADGGWPPGGHPVRIGSEIRVGPPKKVGAVAAGESGGYPMAAQAEQAGELRARVDEGQVRRRKGRGWPSSGHPSRRARATPVWVLKLVGAAHQRGGGGHLVATPSRAAFELSVYLENDQRMDCVDRGCPPGGHPVQVKFITRAGIRKKVQTGAVNARGGHMVATLAHGAGDLYRPHEKGQGCRRVYRGWPPGGHPTQWWGRATRLRALGWANTAVPWVGGGYLVATRSKTVSGLCEDPEKSQRGGPIDRGWPPGGHPSHSHQESRIWALSWISTVARFAGCQCRKANLFDGVRKWHGDAMENQCIRCSVNLLLRVEKLLSACANPVLGFLNSEPSTYHVCRR